MQGERANLKLSRMFQFEMTRLWTVVFLEQLKESGVQRTGSVLAFVEPRCTLTVDAARSSSFSASVFDRHAG